MARDHEPTALRTRPSPTEDGTDEHPDRRSELLDAIVDALLEHGIADLSLRPLAERVGTSARLLIYHFGNKEALLTDALAQVRRRVVMATRQLAEGATDLSLTASLRRFWDWAIAEPNQKYFRLLFEIDGLSMFDQLRFSPEARHEGASVWIGLIQKADRYGRLAPDATARATFIWATMSGLLQECLSTGDRELTTEAFNYFLQCVPSEVPDDARERPVRRGRRSSKAPI